MTTSRSRARRAPSSRAFRPTPAHCRFSTTTAEANRLCVEIILCGVGCDWHEDRYGHISQHRLHPDPLAPALDNASAKKVLPMRLPAHRLRPGDLGSSPIAISLAAHGKVRDCDDQHVLLIGTRKGANLVDFGACSMSGS